MIKYFLWDVEGLMFWKIVTFMQWNIYNIRMKQITRGVSSVRAYAPDESNQKGKCPPSEYTSDDIRNSCYCLSWKNSRKGRRGQMLIFSPSNLFCSCRKESALKKNISVLLPPPPKKKINIIWICLLSKKSWTRLYK